MTTELRRQQQGFARALLTNKPSVLFKPTPQGESAILSVYHNGYSSRLLQALKENYPVLASILGDDDFTALATKFLHDSPSRTPSIRWFGSVLADFLLKQPQALPHPALYDLVRMEWAISTSFDAPNAEPFAVAKVLTVNPNEWPTLRFRTHPTLHLLEMNWKVEPLWTLLTENKQTEVEVPEKHRHHLLIWRVQYTVQWRLVQQIEAQLLEAVADGKMFFELCEIASKSQAMGTAELMASYLKTWMEEGLLIE